MILQINEVVGLLNKESVTVIGLLLAICALLIWDKIRHESKYEKLLNTFHEEQDENKKMLIDVVEKSIVSNEKNTQAINNIENVYRNIK